MDGTRKFLLEQLKGWVAKEPEQKKGSNTYWISGLPRIGKTSLAHSICASLHDESSLLALSSAGGMMAI